MDTSSFDREQARTLGRAVATHDHEALPSEQLQELTALTEAVAGAMETDDVERAAAGLLEFWVGHVAGDLGVALANPDAPNAGGLFEDGFEAGTLGVDLYQALSKVETATNTESDTPALGPWTERLFELTNRHVAHLDGHQ